MGNAGLDEAQAGIKIARRNINNLRYADEWHHLYGRKGRGTEEPHDDGEKGELKQTNTQKKNGLKLNIQKQRR